MLSLKFKAHFTATYRPTDDHQAKRQTIAEHKARAIGVDLTHPQQLKKLTALAQRWIWLAPPNPQQASDPTLRRLVLHLASRAHQWRTPTPTVSYISTTGVYGNAQGQWIHEKTPVAPQSDRAKRRVHAEQQLRIGLKHGVSIHMLRAPGIYSATRLPLERLRQGSPALLPHEDAYSNHIHELDLARLALWAHYKAGTYRIINACDQAPCKMGDYFDAVADAFKLPRPPRLPKAEVQQQVSPAMWSFMSESRRIASLEQAKLGFKLRYPSVQAFLKQGKPQEK